MLRVKELGMTQLDLGYTAELEKKKLGARLQKVTAFVQVSEHFSHKQLEMMA